MLELEQEQLAECFQKLLAGQQSAAEAYEALAAKATDADLRGQAERLIRDKCRHIALTQRLLEIVE